MTTTAIPAPGKYSIGETARRSGFSMDTLRYYEKIGLLVDIDRTATGQRCFTDDDLGWLGMLRCLRDTGMPIEQMLRFAELCRAGEHTVPDRIVLLQQHYDRVTDHIEDLRHKHEAVAAKIAFYRDQ